MATEQVPTPIDNTALKASSRKRSIALGIALAAVVVIFYALTIVKLGPSIFERGL